MSSQTLFENSKKESSRFDSIKNYLKSMCLDKLIEAIRELRVATVKSDAPVFFNKLRF